MSISAKHYINIIGWVEIVKGSVGLALFILGCLPVFLGLQKMGQFGFVVILAAIVWIPTSFLLIGGLGILNLDKKGRSICLVINYGLLALMLFVFFGVYLSYNPSAWAYYLRMLVPGIFILPTIIVLQHPAIANHFLDKPTAPSPKQAIVVIALVGSLLLVIPFLWRLHWDGFYSSIAKYPEANITKAKVTLSWMHTLAGRHYEKVQKYPANYQALLDFDASLSEHFFNKMEEDVYQKKGYYLYEFMPFGDRFLAVANVKGGSRTQLSSYCMTNDGKLRVNEKGRRINNLELCDLLPEVMNGTASKK